MLPRPSTADALLDAAEGLFSTNGYAAVGIRQIVERAGANIAAINYHFGSKHGLYVATVRRAMQQRRTVAAWRVLEPTPADPGMAAAVLVRFIRGFLHGLLPVRGPDVACRLMMREAIHPTAAIEAVTRDFVEPNQRLLKNVIAVLLPEASDDEHAILAQGVLGQILHYRVFLPFVERLPIGGLDDPARVGEIADHIARFSLRGMGLTAARIGRAMDQATALEAAEPAATGR